MRWEAGRAALVCVFVASPAWAHFRLDAPEASLSQNDLGNPQKAPPCGDDGTGTATGMVTTYQEGDTITVTIDEKVFHPGHYRIALSTTGPSGLPEEPVVTAGSSTPCGTVPIQDPPVFPVLADGVFVHDAPFTQPQTIQIQLPPNVTCDNCTLQVIQFMSNHALNNPGGCFYHHCADISISKATGSGGVAGAAGSGGSAGTVGTGGSSTGGAAGSGGTTGAGGSKAKAGTSSDDGGCSCSLPGRGNGETSALMAAAALLLAFGGRRRRVTSG